ncbi:MFS transporter [Actinosynnema sp. NPDC053489]|uniref:MFS transporter n=1 Tax=Actinosynnema sp. NPDC053489 TaxID=3363916 RepID=UPI0037C86634
MDQTTAPDVGTWTGRQKLTLVVLLGAQFMFAVDFSIVTVALPVIGSSLGMALTDFQWIVSAFALAAAGFMLLFGRITDLFGRRRFFLGGMALLTLSSLVGGLATTPALLLAARVGQGLATAVVTPAALSLVTTSFPEGPRRNKVLGLSGALLASGFAAGSLLGGVLTDLLSWRWTFFINVPVGVFLILGGLAVLRESRSAAVGRLDVPGAVTVTAGMLALVYGVTNAERAGWGGASTLGALALSAVLFAAFFLVELRSSNPLVPVQVLRRRTVSWGNLGGLVTFSMASALAFLMTLYLERVLHQSALVTGLIFAAWGVTSVFGGLLAPKAMKWLGSSHAALVAGLTLQALSCAVLFLLGTDTATGIVLVVVCTATNGFGHVFSVVSYTVVAVSGIPDEEQGLATGLASMTQQVAFTVGIPILSAVVAARVDGRPDAGAVLGGVVTGVLTTAAVVAVGAVLVAIFLRRSTTAAVPAPAGAPAAEAGVVTGGR